MKAEEYDAVVVGAGVAGLACAFELQQRGLQTLVLEASDQPGGRIRTDTIEGFRLDRGFQVLLTAYPECRELLDYEKLNLGTFEPGARVWNGSELIELTDPLRRPAKLISALTNPVGTFADKCRIAFLKAGLMTKPIASIYSQPDVPTYNWLRGKRLSPEMLQQFLKPFFSGIFLEEELSTTSRMFSFVFKMFSKGYAALPEGGMQAIPEQLAGKLKEGTIRYKAAVSAVTRNTVTLGSGEQIGAGAVVIATDMNAAAKLNPLIQNRPWNSTTCLYFAIDRPLQDKPVILLNGSGKGCISNALVPSQVAGGYAPEDKHLLCVSLRPGTDVTAQKVIDELQDWLKIKITAEFLRKYEIPHALPRQSPGDNAFGDAELRLEDGTWVCGDYRFSGSIEGAIASGRAVGKSVLSY